MIAMAVVRSSQTQNVSHYQRHFHSAPNNSWLLATGTITGLAKNIIRVWKTARVSFLPHNETNVLAAGVTQRSCMNFCFQSSKVLHLYPFKCNYKRQVAQLVWLWKYQPLATCVGGFKIYEADRGDYGTSLGTCVG